MALITSLTACGSGIVRYVQILNGVSLPGDWELVFLVISTPGGQDVDTNPGIPRQLVDCAIGDCPAIARYYLAAGHPVDLLTWGAQALRASGFTIARENRVGCDRPGSGLACEVRATKDGDAIRIAVQWPGEDSSGLGIADPTRATVRVQALAATR